MAKEKSFIVAVMGLALAYIGFSMLASGVFYAVVSGILTMLGLSPMLTIMTSSFALLLGAVFSIAGMKLFLDNENALSRLLVGLLGLYLVVIGILAAFAGAITFGITLFAALLLWSIGLAFMGYGFQLRFLDPMTVLIKKLKSVLRVG